MTLNKETAEKNSETIDYLKKKIMKNRIKNTDAKTVIHFPSYFFK